jgi:hypothetical protein
MSKNAQRYEREHLNSQVGCAAVVTASAQNYEYSAVSELTLLCPLVALADMAARSAHCRFQKRNGHGPGRSDF